MTLTVIINGHNVPPEAVEQFETEREYETVYSSMPEPDPNWRFVDAQGHEHRWVETEYGDHRTPTLELVVVDTYWCADCHEEHEETRLACRICGEIIKPGMQPPSPFGHHILGQERAKAVVRGVFTLGEEVDVQLLDGEDTVAAYNGVVTDINMAYDEPITATLDLAQVSPAR